MDEELLFHPCVQNNRIGKNSKGSSTQNSDISQSINRLCKE